MVVFVLLYVSVLVHLNEM